MKKEIVRYDSSNPAHREAVRRIVYDTGFGGETVAPYFDNFDLFADMLTLYYTDYDASHNFLAMADGEIAGYLLGCPDTAACDSVTKREIYPALLRGIISGRYKLTKKDLIYIRRSLAAMARGERAATPADVYPAHLHIDFLPQYRRAGLGSKIMLEYMDYLRGLGVKGVHLGTSSAHRSALPFYAKLGFSVYSRKRMTETYFAPLHPQDLYGIVCVKLL